MISFTGRKFYQLGVHIGVIYHMDYSENLSQQYKYEPQSSHFNKNQYSLHCTVKHTGAINSPYEYIYHLSDEKKHNFAFTSVAVNHILELNHPMQYYMA